MIGAHELDVTLPLEPVLWKLPSSGETSEKAW
jgi:hypothetical protein